MEGTESAWEGRRAGASGRASMIWRGLLFATTAVALVVGAHYYVGLRLIDGTGVAAGWRAAAWTLLWLLFASVPGGFAASRLLPRNLAAPIYWVSHFWFGIFGLVLTVVLGTDVLRVAAGWVFDFGPGMQATLARAQAAAIVALVVPAAVVGYRIARGPAKVERIRIPIANLPPALEGVRIVQISDVHIGETLGRDFLERVVAQVNALDADVVAITGDLVDGSVDRLEKDVAPLRDLRAKLGVFYVTGNHEYYHGGSSWTAAVRRLGLHALENEHVVVERGGAQLVIAGVPDREAAHFGTGRGPDVARALHGAPEGAPRVLLAHQPRQAAQAAGNGVDLQLSGHTHGGQIFPFMYFVRLQQPVVSGLHRLNGHWVYTHRGTGYWGPPLRIGPAPEIAVLTLERAPAPA